MGKSDIESGSIFPLFSIYTRRQAGMFLHDQRDIPLGIRVFPSRLADVPTAAFKVNERIQVRDLLVNNDVVNEDIKSIDFTDRYSVFVSKVWYIDPTKANPFQSVDVSTADGCFSRTQLDTRQRALGTTTLYEKGSEENAHDKQVFRFGLMFLTDGHDYRDNFFTVINDPEKPWAITHVVGYELSIIKN